VPIYLFWYNWRYLEEPIKMLAGNYTKKNLTIG